MNTFEDQMGRIITLEKSPERIVSLVPSQTELLFDLGLKDRIVGITQFCTEPSKDTRGKPKIGGTKYVKWKHLHDLNPDLIIGNKEENDEKTIQDLAAKYPVWLSDIATIGDSINMIQQLAKITETEYIAEKIMTSIEQEFNEIQTLPRPEVSAVYLIWREPWMCVGRHTFIHYMMELAGFINCMHHIPRYPNVTISDINRLNPSYILLSSEPFHFRREHYEELRAAIPFAKIIPVDGMAFSWYGSRLVKGLREIKRIRKFLLDEKK